MPDAALGLYVLSHNFIINFKVDVFAVFSDEEIKRKIT